MKKHYEIDLKHKIKVLDRPNHTIRIGDLYDKVDYEARTHLNTMNLIEKGYLDKKATIKLVIEYEEEILDEIEKRYLENLLRPFKNRDIKVKKCEHFGDEYLYIYIDDYSNEMYFPEFRKGTMYKGMKKDYEYDIYELKLFQ